MDRVGLACAAATALTWGLVGPIVRAIPGLTAPELVAGRLAFALAAVLPALAVAPTRAATWHALRSPPAWALGALLGTYYLLAVAAFRIAPVADVALLLATAPLCALALRRLGGTPIRGREQAGALVALAGVALTLVPSLRAAAVGGAARGAPARLLGDLLALTAAAASAAYALVFAAMRRTGPGTAANGPPATPRAPAPLGVAVLTFALGTGALAVRAAVLGVPLVRTAALDARGWTLLAVLGVVSTGVPTLAFATAARRLPPVVTSAAQLLVPVVAAAAAAVTLGERPSPWLVPGGVLVAIGLLTMLRGAAPSAATAAGRG